MLKKAKPEPEQPTPVSRPEPTRKFVDYEREDSEVQAPAPLADKVVRDPKDGTIVSIRPGETALIVFQFANIISAGQRPQPRTFVLQEDRALAADWISIVQDQVNVTPNGTGELRVLLKPPVGADPANYPFVISTGPYGQPLKPCNLTLNVQAVPSVALKCKEPVSKTGPVGRVVQFQFSVENAGNADTAYRVAVRDPEIDKDPAGRPTAPDELYEVANWRYLFDKELDSLITPSSARTMQPNLHKVQAVRKGIWWLGWKEKHSVSVSGVPVTDVLNGGKPGNSVQLTAVRWRIFPLPWFLMAPIFLLLLMMFGSGSGPVNIDNAFVSVAGEQPQYFVLGTELMTGTGTPVDMTVNASWSAPFYAWLTVNKDVQGATAGSRSVSRAGRTNLEDVVAVERYGTTQLVRYGVRPVLWRNVQEATVRFVPLRTEDFLRLSLGSGIAAPQLSSVPTSEDYGTGQTVEGQEYTIIVPSGGRQRISFRNISPTTGGQSIAMWLVKEPDGFKLEEFRTGDLFREVNAASSVTPIIEHDSSSGQSRGEFLILTTDKRHQLIRIVVEVTEN
ncbi:conserved hypothetical protein [Candidatus Nitrosymbiomonas proteolyticus]|uniref:CARDB domain-containing protein n=1 Tax=Candidatus Nitrosymbiomonas proteolyticus TaxID=2608984 RepID=A0A809RAL0_9BACT|nr:conserved hypothetical protein [Candidatus Nitrosymbiomonas proteolyticus]